MYKIIYYHIFTKINFLKGKPDEFLSWLCNILDLRKINKNEYIIDQ